MSSFHTSADDYRGRMGSRHFALCCALLALAGGSACAVNRPGDNPPRCSVQGAELLPPGSGGAEALCEEIDAAVSALANPPKVAVRVVAPHILAAKINVGGRELPELKFSRSDRELDRSAFQRFARAIVDTAANASK